MRNRELLYLKAQLEKRLKQLQAELAEKQVRDKARQLEAGDEPTRADDDSESDEWAAAAAIACDVSHEQHSINSHVCPIFSVLICDISVVVVNSLLLVYVRT